MDNLIKEWMACYHRATLPIEPIQEEKASEDVWFRERADTVDGTFSKDVGTSAEAFVHLFKIKSTVPYSYKEALQPALVQLNHWAFYANQIAGEKTCQVIEKLLSHSVVIIQKPLLIESKAAQLKGLFSETLFQLGLLKTLTAELIKELIYIAMKMLAALENKDQSLFNQLVRSKRCVDGIK
jgi:hypothetical protein